MSDGHTLLEIERELDSLLDEIEEQAEEREALSINRKTVALRAQLENSALWRVNTTGLSDCERGQHGCKLMESNRRDLRVDWIFPASCIHHEAAIRLQILTGDVKPLLWPSGEAALDLDGPQALTGNLQQ